MAQFKRIVQNFAELAEASTLVAANELRPNITGTNPGFIYPPVAVSPGALNAELSVGNTSLAYLFAPLFGEAPYILRAVAQKHKDKALDASRPTYEQELSGPEQGSLALDNRYSYVVNLTDVSGAKVPLDKVFFAGTSATGGTWTSKPIYLSSLLLSVDEVLPKATTVGWTFEYAPVSGADASFPFKPYLPGRPQILHENITGLRIRATYTGSDVRANLYSLVVSYSEAYATSSPQKAARHQENNLYEPRLKVMLDTLYDVTPFVASFSGNSLSLVVPDSRLETLLFASPNIAVSLDGNEAFNGRATAVKKQEYATGTVYQLSLKSLFDMLGNKMDTDILTGDLDGDGKLELAFTSDASYIAFVTQNTPGVATRPLLYKGGPWRPVEAWYQGGFANEVPKLVQLDADYDWYQLYATQNQSLRGKLKDVANANLYDLTSVAGRPALVPMVGSPDTFMDKLAAVTYNMTAAGTYLPESRLFVPEYTFSPAELPKSVKVQGMASAGVAADEDVTQAVYLLRDDGVTDLFKIETGGAMPVEYFFCDESGNAAVIARGSIQPIDAKLHVDIDLNPFVNARGKYEFIESSEYPDYAPGYSGFIGVRMSVTGGFLIAANYSLRVQGHYLYSASGERGEAPEGVASGEFMPRWAGLDVQFISELVNTAQDFPKDDEVVENAFVPQYNLPKGVVEMTQANITLALAGRPPLYFQSPTGIYAELYGYRLHDKALSELADAHALRRVLELLTIELKYVGHPGLSAGQFVGIARRPEAGLHAAVEAIDYFRVLGDFSLDFQAGQGVTTSMSCGYVGTYYPLLGTRTREVGSVHWQKARAPIDEVFYF